MIQTEFPGLKPATIEAVARNAAFYINGYDIIVNRIIDARGHNVFLGTKPSLCRFCGGGRPEVTFRKEAHAVPELAGNGTLLTHYECDECNQRFSAFEDDLGKMTFLGRAAGLVLGKSGIPSLTSRKGKSRVDADAAGFRMQDHEDDPIFAIDHDRKTCTVKVAPHSYRPLGVFKALVKIAVTLMPEEDVAKVPEALRWLRSKDLINNRIDDGTGYGCLRTFTPGVLPFGATRVMMLRRKGPDLDGPCYIFVLAFGNMSLQITLPAPQVDKHLIGKTVTIRAVPLMPWLVPARVQGSTSFGITHLSPPDSVKGAEKAVFHFDRMVDEHGNEVTGAPG